MTTHGRSIADLPADNTPTAEATAAEVQRLLTAGTTIVSIDGKRAVTVAQSVEQVKKEVLEILRDGVQTSRGFERPSADDIKNFGTLHDLCDANCLGWLCDEDVVFVDEQGPILDHNGSDENNDRWIQFGNTVQAQVHAWIEAKGHHPAAASDSNPEGVIQQSLVVAFDVTGWTRQQIDSLQAAAAAQGEAVFDTFAVGSEDDQSHPDVESVNYEIIEHDGDLDLTGVLHVGLGH